MVLSGAARLTGVNHVTYNVKDKDRALKWWEEVLGIKQIPKMVNSEHLYWLQLPSGCMVHIIENAAGASMPSHHAAFEVDNIEAAEKALHDAGVETEGPIQTRNDGQKAFYLKDPDGNRVEICTKSGFGVLV
jgi:catechol 2,3-dioxygenase-like lactoylglutathione lyase family enzyme